MYDHLTAEQRLAGDDRLLHALFPRLCPAVPDEEAWYTSPAARARALTLEMDEDELNGWDEEEIEELLGGPTWAVR